MVDSLSQKVTELKPYPKWSTYNSMESSVAVVCDVKSLRNKSALLNCCDSCKSYSYSITEFL